MDSGLLLASISTLSCVGLALALALRRERSAVASTMLAMLGALALWSAAHGLAIATDSAAWREAAIQTSALSGFAVSGLWVLLALRHRFPRRFDGGAATLLALLPAIVFFAVAMIDPNHGWAFRTDPALGFGAGWMGPLARVLSVVAFVAWMAGSVLFVLSGLRLWRHGERRSGLALLLALTSQLFTGIVAMDGPGDTTYVLAAASATLGALVLATTALRYSLLAPPPLGHRQVIDCLAHGVLMASARGEILDHNAAAERLIGGHPGGRSIADAVASLVPALQRETVRDALDRVEHSLEPATLQLESDRHRHIEVSVRPIADDRGSAIGQIAVLRDRSQEWSWAEAALRARQLEAMGTLAGGIAHEVNNPLAFVHANLGEIARLSELVTAWRAERESKLADQLAEMGELAREALDGLRRIQSAVSDVQRLIVAPDSTAQIVSLEDVARDAARLLELRANHRIQVRTRFATGLPPIRGSPALLVQALLSVMMSTRRALETAAEASIELETGAGAGDVWLRVRDRDPDFDAARATLHERLATSLAAGIAREHGGALAVEPCEQGIATVLRFPARWEG
jgi:nitrogen-specific signal transduction histidine kinase